MKNRKLILIVSLVLAMTMSLGGTLAYLTDTDSDVNVMTLGSVKIEQHEYQRAEGESHINAGAEEGDLVPFEQGQLLLPAVPKADDAYEAEQAEDKCFHWGVYSPGWNGLWDDDKLANVMDKMVFVENTGKSDAYYRTIIALECPEGMTIGYASQGAEIEANCNGNTRFVWDYKIGHTIINGTRYELWCATYTDILKPGEISRPSLLQVILTHYATNEDMELLGDTYDILVVTQAVQAGGFADAATALNTAFGEVSVNSHPWMDGEEGDQEPDELPIPVVVSNADELAAALAEGGNVVLTADITTNTIKIETGKQATINLNGKTLTATAKSEDRTNYALDNYGTLTLTGNGTIEARGVENFGTMIVEDGVKIVSKDANGGSAIWNEGGHLTINGGIFTTANLTANDMGPAALTNNGGTVVVNNGTFDGESPRCYAVLNNSGKMTINNATVTGKHGAVGVSGGEVIINGGSFTCEGVAGQSDHALYCEAGTVTINGGTIVNQDHDAGGKDIWVATGATVVDKRASN